MATKNKKQEDIQTLDTVDEAATKATDESKIENGEDTDKNTGADENIVTNESSDEGENPGESDDSKGGEGGTDVATGTEGTIVLDDDSGIRPLAADDYVENFEVGGKTLAVRDVEAQDSITQLNSEVDSLSSELESELTVRIRYGLESIGLSDTPELADIISAMSSNNITVLLLQPSESRGFITATTVWGFVLVLSTTNNRNCFISINANSLEYGGYWDSKLYHWEISPNLSEILNSHNVEAYQVSTASTITIDYSNYNSCWVFVVRAAYGSMLRAYDTWSDYSELASTGTLKDYVSFSCSDRVIKFTNNTTNAALNVIAIMGTRLN